MGVVTNIIDALRRVGRPTQKSALRRQDKQLQGKEVLSRGRVTVRSELGMTETFAASMEPIPETVTPLSENEARPIYENALLASRFLDAFTERRATAWSLDDLDEAFTAWSGSDEKHGYTDEAVVEILGAAYGQLCIERLNMRWVKISDSDGTALAVQGLERDFRAFPYHSVSKRIADREAGFFGALFVSLQSMSQEDLA